jgi:hypothetical protein
MSLFQLLWVIFHYTFVLAAFFRCRFFLFYSKCLISGTGIYNDAVQTESLVVTCGGELNGRSIR